MNNNHYHEPKTQTLAETDNFQAWMAEEPDGETLEPVEAAVIGAGRERRAVVGEEGEGVVVEEGLVDLEDDRPGGEVDDVDREHENEVGLDGKVCAQHGGQRGRPGLERQYRHLH